MKEQGRKDLKKYIPVSDEDITLALSWMKDEVAISSQMRKLGKRTWGSAIYAKLARGLRDAYRKGLIKVK